MTITLVLIIIILIITIVCMVLKKPTNQTKNQDNHFMQNDKGLIDLNYHQYYDFEKHAQSLNNILDNAREILKEDTFFEYTEKHPIFAYIRTFTMYIQTKNSLNIAKQNGDKIKYISHPSETKESFNYTSAYFNFFDEYIKKYAVLNKKSILLNNHLTINLGIDPIVSQVWKVDRLSDNLRNIGQNVIKKNLYLVDLPKGFIEKPNKFKQDNNHNTAYIYPIGYIQVLVGNHSINAGIMKSEGELKVTNIYDVSSLYKRYSFDGTYLIDHEKDKKTELIFEFGALFEIGRIMLDYPELFPEEIQNTLDIGGKINE